MGNSVRPLVRGSNPFPFDSPFIDVCSRLGLPVTQLVELECFWWFMRPDDCPSPDDFASALMAVLPIEEEEEAEKRRSLITMGLEVKVTLHEKVKVKERKGSSTK